MDGVDSS